MIAGVNRDPKKTFPAIEKFWPLPTDDNGIHEDSEEKRLMGILEKFKQGKLYK